MVASRAASLHAEVYSILEKDATLVLIPSVGTYSQPCPSSIPMSGVVN